MSIYFLGEVGEELVKEYQSILTNRCGYKLDKPLTFSETKDLFTEKCVDRKMFRINCILRGISPQHLADIEYEAGKRLGLYSKFPGWENIEKIVEEIKEE